MAQGQDRIASSLLELQPTAIIELFLLYFNTVDNPNAFIAFHGGSVYNKGIVWQGVEYLPIPVETDGFEVNANGQLARPKIRISNKDYFATDLLINNDDLQFAKVIRKRTFIKYLDDVNFDGGNPWGQADASAELSNDTFVIGQKTAENKVFIELELTSPLDLENFEVNNRLIMSRYCSWHYRGNGCNYKGIPIATEIGESLTVADPIDWFSNQAKKQWSEQVYYQSGQTAYIENQKITIADPTNPSQTEFAKIWYVCQSGHLNLVPDKNPSAWKRDGCNKKLDGCKLRFGRGSLQFNEFKGEKTVDFLDFTDRTGSLRYNNIAPNATLTVSSAANGYPASNTVDLITGGNSIWQTLGNATTGGVLTFEWDRPRDITRIDIYDNPDTTRNFNNASVRCFNSAGTLLSGFNMTGIPTSGTRLTRSFSRDGVKKITISGSGVALPPSLSEVAIFGKSPYFYYPDVSGVYPSFAESALPLHLNNFFQISTWVGLSGRDLYQNELYSVFHNIQGGCRYSGINLYLSGQNLLLDFATRTTGAGAGQFNKTISMPWSNDELKPLHLICSGGSGSGVNPTATTPGYIEVTDGISVTGRYVLSGSVGEYFRFKNPNYQNGISPALIRWKFGINDWQFPTGNEFVPNPPAPPNQITSNMDLISPIKFGPTIIWTGSSGINYRINDHNKSIYREYEEFQQVSSNTNGLLAYWEMVVNTGFGFIINSENTPIRQLVIENDESVSYHMSNITSEVSFVQLVDTPKQQTDLPFGGFPGTEKYG